MKTLRNVLGPIREKPHRLPKEFYLSRTVSFTACVQPRIAVLNSGNVFEGLRDVLIEAVRHYECEVILYLFMPDHLHCIVQGLEENSDPLSAMKRFKQRSGHWKKRSGIDFEWQKDFYDHILRNERDLQKHIRYILLNPVRAGLVGRWSDYPWKGSTVFDIESWDDR